MVGFWRTGPSALTNHFTTWNGGQVSKPSRPVRFVDNGICGNTELAVAATAFVRGCIDGCMRAA